MPLGGEAYVLLRFTFFFSLPYLLVAVQLFSNCFRGSLSPALLLTAGLAFVADVGPLIETPHGFSASNPLCDFPPLSGSPSSIVMMEMMMMEMMVEMMMSDGAVSVSLLTSSPNPKPAP